MINKSCICIFQTNAITSLSFSRSLTPTWLSSEMIFENYWSSSLFLGTFLGIFGKVLNPSPQWCPEFILSLKACNLSYLTFSGTFFVGIMQIYVTTLKLWFDGGQPQWKVLLSKSIKSPA